MEDVKSETSGNFENLLVALLTPIIDFYVKELNDAMAGIGTNEDVLIEILCTMSNYEIHAIKHAYERRKCSISPRNARNTVEKHLKACIKFLRFLRKYPCCCAILLCGCSVRQKPGDRADVRDIGQLQALAGVAVRWPTR